MAYQIQDDLYVSEKIRTPFYLGQTLQYSLGRRGDTYTILTFPKGLYSAIVLDVYIRSEEQPYAGVYAQQTVSILINTTTETNTNINPYYGQIYTSTTTTALGPGAIGTPPNYDDMIFTPNSIIYSSQLVGENMLIKATNDIAYEYTLTYEYIARAFLAG
jgi:hypothetical protein